MENSILNNFQTFIAGISKKNSCVVWLFSHIFREVFVRKRIIFQSPLDQLLLKYAVLKVTILKKYHIAN